MLHSITAKEYMAGSLVTFLPETDIYKAIDRMLENGISGAPVVDKRGDMVGMLSEKDCLKVALNAGYHGDSGGTVADFMTPSVETVESDSSILEVAKLFLEKPYKRYPVVEDNRLVGQISRSDVLRALDKIRD